MTDSVRLENVCQLSGNAEQIYLQSIFTSLIVGVNNSLCCPQISIEKLPYLFTVV